MISEVQRLILATDMTRHADYIRTLEWLSGASGHVRTSDEVVDSPDELLREDCEHRRRFETELLLKCADTSNVLRPFHVARGWAVRAQFSSDLVGITRCRQNPHLGERFRLTNHPVSRARR